MNRSLTGPSNICRAASAPALLALILGLSACGGGGSGNGPGSVNLNLTIGNALPLQGVNKELGDSGQKASALAVAKIRQAIDEVGAHHTVRTVSADQGLGTASASIAAKKLVANEGATCLTGPWSADAVARVATDVAVPSKVLQISPVPTGSDVSELNDHDLVNSTALPVSLEGSALSKAIGNDLRATQGKTVNVAAGNDPYDATLSQDFILAWQGDKGSIGTQVPLGSSTPVTSSTTTTSPTGSTSGSSAAVFQLLSNSPDAALIIDNIDGFSQIAPSLSSSSSWNPSTAWGSDQLASPGLPAQVGSGAVDGMRVLAPGSPSNEPATTAFVDAFRSANPHAVKMAPYAAQEFDATVLCYLASVAAGSTDGQKMADELIDITAPGGEKFSWQQLPDAIRALQDGKDIDYTGASGPIDMDVHGDPTAGVFDVYRYTANGLRPVAEVPVQKPNPAENP